jgi:hypothetical protein
MPAFRTLDDASLIADTPARAHRRLRSCGRSASPRPDGHIWYVRRRWAKRQLDWKRRANYELSPAERDAVPIVADTDELLGPVSSSSRLTPSSVCSSSWRSLPWSRSECSPWCSSTG